MSFTLPLYIDRGEHPEAREQVGHVEVKIRPGEPTLIGDVVFDEDHRGLADLLDTMNVTHGFGPKGGCVVLRPPTQIEQQIKRAEQHGDS